MTECVYVFGGKNGHTIIVKASNEDLARVRVKDLLNSDPIAKRTKDDWLTVRLLYCSETDKETII